ncbi:putative PIG3 family NAD(P)H quinone oxidoreductase [Halospina denitrificans]|uniref:Putative PIG3 family NAD(P)H quinone oxidoreductase n=1 Tax=Halospina denitrificans TaxID=332522 RepID=A0A4R7K124_9GAMM|nr:NAD(P)H-quinone oxidoreductase [Halospina denitrificans]TDT44275.1 putative PIG3 family NAD(P)H quinone oxidoreductase [Halospina denitrificans]
MKAIAVSDNGLEWVEQDDPGTPGAGEVLIDVAWAGMNRADLMQRAGAYPPPEGASPILGLEVSGVVRELGAEVTGLTPGDEVCALLTGGGYAERVRVPASQVLPIPEGVSLRDAAGLPEVFATAWLNLYREAVLAPGERILLHAGASGLGTAVIQLARVMGNPVFVTVGSDDKIEACRALGADDGWNRHKGSFVEAVRNWGGADMVLDPVGGDYIRQDQSVLNADGRIVVIGLMGGREADMDLGYLLVKRQRLIGSTLRSQPVSVKGEVMAALREHVWPRLSSGEIRPVIDCTFAITQADEAMGYLQANDNTGKVLLAVQAQAE